MMPGAYPPMLASVPQETGARREGVLCARALGPQTRRTIPEFLVTAR